MSFVQERKISNIFFCCKDKIVRLEKLGSLYPTLSSEGTATEKEFTVSKIKSVGVNYRAGNRIIEAMKAAGFEKKK